MSYDKERTEAWEKRRGWWVQRRQWAAGKLVKLVGWVLGADVSVMYAMGRIGEIRWVEVFDLTAIPTMVIAQTGDMLTTIQRACDDGPEALMRHFGQKAEERVDLEEPESAVPVPPPPAPTVH